MDGKARFIRASAAAVIAAATLAQPASAQEKPFSVEQVPQPGSAEIGIVQVIDDKPVIVRTVRHRAARKARRVRLPAKDVRQAGSAAAQRADLGMGLDFDVPEPAPPTVREGLRGRS